MTENILLELLKQAPNAVAVIVTVYLFLNHQKQTEVTRTENAKKLEEERQRHERDINNMWAGYLKRLTEQNTENFTAIIKEVERHEDRSLARYNRMSKVTRQKLKAVK